MVVEFVEEKWKIGDDCLLEVASPNSRQIVRQHQEDEGVEFGGRQQTHLFRLRFNNPDTSSPGDKEGEYRKQDWPKNKTVQILSHI